MASKKWVLEGEEFKVYKHWAPGYDKHIALIDAFEMTPEWKSEPQNRYEPFEEADIGIPFTKIAVEGIEYWVEWKKDRWEYIDGFIPYL